MKFRFVFQFCFLIIAILSQSSALIAQVEEDEGYLTTSFRVTDENKLFINGVKIIYTDLNTNQVEYKTASNGKVDIKLRLDRNYLIIISDPAYYTKTIEVKTHIREIGYSTSFFSNIEVTLLENCEKNPSRSNILDKPVGRVIYDNYKRKFVYDYSYTEKMATLYMEEYYIRCEQFELDQELALAEEKQKQALEKTNIEALQKEEKKKASLLEKEKKEIEIEQKKAAEEEKKKIAEAKVKLKQLEKADKERKKIEEKEKKQFAKEEKIRQEAKDAAARKAIENEKIVLAAKKAEEKKQEITDNNLEEQEIESEKAIEKVDIVENAEIKAPTYIRPQPIKKQAIFDQSKDFIFLESKNSWPSELRNYILNSAYNAKAIGTYAYTQQEDKKEFFIEDVPELREKFPTQFEKAFDNWDYIVDTYSKYLEDNK